MSLISQPSFKGALKGGSPCRVSILTKVFMPCYKPSHVFFGHLKEPLITPSEHEKLAMWCHRFYSNVVLLFSNVTCPFLGKTLCRCVRFKGRESF